MEIKEITKIQLEEGDVLAVKLPEAYGEEGVQMVMENLKTLFPNNKCIVYTDEIVFQKLTGAKMEGKTNE